MPPIESTPSLPKARPCIPAADREALLADFDQILSSGRLTMGPYLERFEHEFAAAVGVESAVGMSSGTAPLEVALRFWDLAGGEVVVPTNTFIASANAVLLAGGAPVLCDIDPETLSSSWPQIEAKISARTRGVIVVHIAGLIAPDIAEIRAKCRKRGLFLLEDAAHAHGAAAAGRSAGAWGDAAAFSFFPTKPLTTGEGGMLCTDDLELAAFARSFRTHGMADAGRSLVRLGSNYRLPELSAALGVRQLARLEESIAERNRLAGLYRRELESLATGAVPLPVPSGWVHAYYKFPVLLPEGIDRDQVVGPLRERYGVEVGSIYWPPCHLEPFFRDELGHGEGDFPVAERVLRRIVALPIFVGLEAGDIAAVCRGLADVLAEVG